MIFSRIAAWFTGVAAQAIAAAVVVGLITGAVVWLRHDARMDERAHWEKRMASARFADQMKAIGRERIRQEVALKNAEEAAKAQAQAESDKQEVSVKLSARKRVIVYPKEIVEALNK